MRSNNDELTQWAKRMERGERDDELLALAAQLEQARFDEGALPSIAFQRQLRRDLLNQHQAATQPGQPLWQRAGSLAALGLLAALALTVWLTMSSAGRSTPGDAPAHSELPSTATSIINVPPSVGYILLDSSVSGSNSEDMIMEVATSWSVPVSKRGQPIFALHLLDSEGQIVAQSDAVLSPTGVVTLPLNIPADLASGDYELEGILYDPASGERLMFGTPNGETLSEFRSRFRYLSGAGFYDGEEFKIIVGNFQRDDAPANLSGGDTLVVREVTPSSGTIISGTKPVEIAVTIDYTLSSLSQAILEVRVADLQGEGGRGVGLATVEGIGQGSGTTTVVVTLDSAELPAPTDLGLWLQLKPDERSAPIVMELPEAFRWRYEP